MMFQYHVEQYLPITKTQAWTFFSTPKNLSVITPPEMEFNIITSIKDEPIYDGMKINYSVKPLFGIKMRWQTEICKVEDHHQFIDRQTIGPYKFWEHTHTFIEKNNGMIISDLVNYELPFGLLGRMVNSVIIKRKLDHIFDYRKMVLQNLFS